MNFDAEAYAEGICNSAAGSSIEVLVDHIDATVTALDDDSSFDQVTLAQLGEDWRALRDAIVEREREQGEDTVFADD